MHRFLKTKGARPAQHLISSVAVLLPNTKLATQLQLQNSSLRCEGVIIKSTERWFEASGSPPVVVFLASDEAYMVSGATDGVIGRDGANYAAGAKASLGHPDVNHNSRQGRPELF
jgi:hypothetical protein